jgi:putative ABC transport system permease protein
VRQARGSAATATPIATRPVARPSWLAGALTRAGTVTGGIGARMAFEPGHGRTAVPVRSALAGTVIAAATPDVTGYALGDIGQLSIGRTQVPVVGVDPVHGDGYLTMLAGRPPVNTGEIALGAQTMRALGVRIGQTVRARVDWATGELGPATQHLLRVPARSCCPTSARPG